MRELVADGFLTVTTSAVFGKRRKNYEITAAEEKVFLNDARVKLGEQVFELLEDRDPPRS